MNNDSVAKHDKTTAVSVKEELGHAQIEFQFTADASMRTVVSFRKLLSNNGFEEQTDDSGIGETLRWEWDKSNLSRDE